MCSSDFLLALIAVVFPPLAVWVKRGVCSADSLINIALCCLGFLPGLLHAWYIVAKFPEDQAGRYAPVDTEAGNQRVYVYTATYPSAAAHTQPQYTPQNKPKTVAKPQGKAGPQHYGATNTTASAAQGPQFLPSETPADVGEGSSTAPAGQGQQPPSYNDAIKGDFKVQSKD